MMVNIYIDDEYIEGIDYGTSIENVSSGMYSMTTDSNGYVLYNDKYVLDSNGDKVLGSHSLYESETKYDYT